MKNIWKASPKIIPKDSSPRNTNFLRRVWHKVQDQANVRSRIQHVAAYLGFTHASGRRGSRVCLGSTGTCQPVHFSKNLFALGAGHAPDYYGRARYKCKQNANVGLGRGEMIFQEARKLFVFLVELARIELATS
jgi:hypothetical protein